MEHLFNIARTLLENGQPFVMATIVAHSGSTPRTAGTKMIINTDGRIEGTIGGGIVEAEVIKAGLDLYRTGGAVRRRFDLSRDNTLDSLDVICGGRLDVLIERFDANQENREIFDAAQASLAQGQSCLLVTRISAEVTQHSAIDAKGHVLGDPLPEPLKATVLRHRPARHSAPTLLDIEGLGVLIETAGVRGSVFIFGAGHVSVHLARLTAMVAFRTVVLDDRKAFANPDRFPQSDQVVVLDHFDDAFNAVEIEADSYIVIITRGHRHDKIVLAQALKSEAGYIGMIGSRRKRNTIYRQLLAQGFSQSDIDRVHSPIGMRIGAETPEEIAVSIVAQLIQIRAQKAR